MSAQLVSKRLFYKNILRRSLTFAVAATDQTTVNELQVRLKLVEDTWKLTLPIEMEIEELTGAAELDFQQIEFADIEQIYLSGKIKLTALIKDLEDDDTSDIEEVPRQENVTRMEVKLPNIQIPKFNGDYTLWSSFRDMFTTTIGNRYNLSGAQKIHYLKMYLEGEAAQLSRYDNKRLLVGAQFRRLFGQSPIHSESPLALRKLIDTTTECLRALNSLELPTEHWDAVIVDIVAQRLDVETHKQWELSLTHNNLPTFEELKDHLEKRCRSLEAVGSTLSKTKPAVSSTKKAVSTASSSRSSFHANTSDCCAVCSEEHTVPSCPKFAKMGWSAKRQTIQRKKLCYLCLSRNCRTGDCKASSCSTCSGRHHNLLHYRKEEKPVVEPSSESSTVAETITSHVGINADTSQILLSTAWVRVSGTNELVRALVDSGSQATFIAEKCVQRLRLNRKRVSIPVNGLGSLHAGHASAMVTFNITSLVDDSFVLGMNALVLPKLTSVLPIKLIPEPNRPKFVGISLADPEYYKPGDIELLIGADFYGKLLINGLIPGSNGVPTAQNTALGWILSGPVSASERSSDQFACNTSILSLHLEVESNLRKFWEIEEVGPANLLTTSEEMCETHFKTTHTRNSTGRFVVRLPFNDRKEPLGNSRRAAVKRLLQVERRLDSTPALKNEYIAFMREYSSLGHMHIASRPVTSEPHSYYLPHHCVVKDSSSTTKLRVVFDGSSKTTTGVSINEKQLIGPRQQDELFQIVVRFRQHKIAFTADIAKMYRQVRVSEEDWDYQRILWREKSTDPIQDWVLNTVTYGMAAAPFMAIRALRQLAFDEAEKYPVASQVVLSDFYVDDLITGCDSVEEAISLQTELCQLLRIGGFDLRKWSSNSSSLVGSIPSNQLDPGFSLTPTDDSTINALGMLWYPTTDTFGFKVRMPADDSSLVTKRSILSTIARLFDPLGFLSPSIIIGKILIQDLWTAGLDWDQKVPPVILEKWIAFRQTLPSLELIRIPRWLGTRSGELCEIHAFCDASQVAYGAVVYVRFVLPDGSISVNIIAAKTKVAPTQTMTIPRLELCAAVLLAKLVKYVSETLRLKNMDTYAWSDSQVVLCWLRKTPRTWKTFVSNRVSYIQSHTSPDRWRYVPTATNPADYASRGVLPSDLGNDHMWFHGPPWLREDSSQWPAVFENPTAESTQLEMKTVAVMTTTVPEVWDLSTRFSKLWKLKRVTAYVLRFVSNLRCKNSERKVGWLTNFDLQEALWFWMKRDQHSNFSAEIRCLKEDITFPRKSAIKSLDPYLDENGLLRVGGRIRAAKKHLNTLHPIILPKVSVLTNLIIADTHLNLLHGGVQLMLANLRRTVWIMGSRNMVRQYIHRCIICFRQKPRLCHQLMGNLPVERVSPGRAFLRSGVDYAGPIILKSSTGRGCRHSKAYISLFVCFATKAIHLELVSDLTSAAFLAAFRRFTARRGKCAEMFSDFGTNFVGANRELSDLRKILKSSEYNDVVSRALSNDGTNWRFIPPGSPHFGGLWEAGVKAMKHHLRRIVGPQPLTFEEMSTTLAEIEACLNSRPLCALSDDPEDISALTPGHFLIGEALTVVPAVDVSSTPINRLTRWSLIKRLTQDFWYRWSNEYLTTLQQRPKWHQEHENVKIGQLALIKDERLPPAKWAMGRIIETHPGLDGLVRVATLKCGTGTLKRTIKKLCILPVE